MIFFNIFILQSEVSLKFYFAILIFAKNIKKLVIVRFHASA